MLDNYTICQRLELHEGLRLQPYRCSRGKLTIGIGRNLEANPITPEEELVVGDWRHGITKCMAVYLLLRDVQKIIAKLNKQIKFFKQLDDERQYALLDMAYNMGVGGLLKFKKMLLFMQKGDFEQASTECLNSRYAKDVKGRAERSAELIRTGVFKL